MGLQSSCLKARTVVVLSVVGRRQDSCCSPCGWEKTGQLLFSLWLGEDRTVVVLPVAGRRQDSCCSSCGWEKTGQLLFSLWLREDRTVVVLSVAGRRQDSCSLCGWEKTGQLLFSLWVGLEWEGVKHTRESQESVTRHLE